MILPIEDKSLKQRMKRMIQDRLIKYASRLRFPRLLALAAAVFVADLIVPYVVPFADEILLGLITLLLAMLKSETRDSNQVTSRNP